MTKVVIPAAGLGYELLRVWPDWTSDTTPIIAFVIDLAKDRLIPEVVTLTGGSLNNEDEFSGAVVLPDRRVVDGCGEYADSAAFVVMCRVLKADRGG